MKSFLRFLGVVGVLCLTVAARADTILLLEDPVNFEGWFTSAGHSVVWMDRLCTDNHIKLRPCRTGEAGVVLSRYGKLGGNLDWLAMPVGPYLYAVDNVSEVPTTMTKAAFEQMQVEAKQRYAGSFAQDPGEKIWGQLTGEAYRRRILMVRVHTTLEQETRTMEWLNDRPNQGHFNVLSSNCSDFVGSILGKMLPGGFHRNYLFDSGMMTPKQNVADLHRYAKRHPELGFEASVLPQVPGEMKRSGHVRGVTEAYLKNWWFLLPLDYLLPIELGAVTVSGLADHRYVPKPKDVPDQAEFFGRETVARSGR